MLSKAVLRQAFRTNLERDDQNLSAPTLALCERIAAYLKTQSGVWAGFEPLGFEADIRSVYAHAPHITWAYPRIEHETLRFYSVRSRDELVQNQWNIWEPDPTRARLVHHDELHGLLVPGLAFDESGNRLGRGRGYYDRAFAEILTSNQPLKIGIALERQVSKQELPHDAHDVPMDFVITEARILARRDRASRKETAT